MKTAAATLIAIAILLTGLTAAQADFNYTGSLSSTGTNPGLNAVGPWGPINLSWTVTSETGSTWRYRYDVTSEYKAFSHLLLEASSSFAGANIWAYTGPIELNNWNPGPGNPSLPSPMYGIKFDWGGSTSVVYQFDSDRAPIWGDIYAKDGTGNYVWNKGFTSPDTDPLGPRANGSLLNHLLVPDTTGPPDTDVPEPASMLLGLCALGAGGLGGFLRKRRARRQS